MEVLTLSDGNAEGAGAYLSKIHSLSLSLCLSNKTNNENKKKVFCVSLSLSLSAFSLYIHDDDYYTDFMTPTREFNLIRISFHPNLHFARISISFRPHLFSPTPGFSSPCLRSLFSHSLPNPQCLFFFLFFHFFFF